MNTVRSPVDEEPVARAWLTRTPTGVYWASIDSI